jgi:hypothetical protein
LLSRGGRIFDFHIDGVIQAASAIKNDSIR